MQQFFKVKEKKMQEHSTVISQARNLKYTDNSGNDVIYDVVIVTRNPFSYNDTGFKEIFTEEEWNGYMYSAVLERVKFWYQVATDVWNGFNRTESDYESIEKPFEYSVPVKDGAPNVTIFGNIIDQFGRSFSLTVTDQSDKVSVYQQLPYFIGLYDEITTSLSGNVDLNAFGDKHVRRTTAPQFEKNFGKENKKSLSMPKVKKTKPEIEVYDTIDEVRKLGNNSKFSMRVAAIRHNEKSFSVYGYTTNTPDKIEIVEWQDNIWIYNSRDCYKDCMEFMQTNADGFEYHQLTNSYHPIGHCFVNGTKMVSKDKGTAYWVDLELSIKS